MKKIIAASILSADLANLAHDIKECESSGVDWIHVDVMDGHFVPNLTMGAVIVRACRRSTDLHIDCHLMIEKPENLVSDFAESGANSITIHPENNPNVHRTIQLIHSLGIQAGVALNPGTPVELIQPLLPFVDLILIMTVNPGFSGQAFIPEMLSKVKQISGLINQTGRPIRLEVDGGINAENILDLQSAGANTFVSASSIFNHADGISAGVTALKNAIV